MFSTISVQMLKRAIYVKGKMRADLYSLGVLVVEWKVNLETICQKVRVKQLQAIND